MPINRLLKHAAFGPEEVAPIIAAFEGACGTLGLTDRNDPVVETVAKAILHAAEHDASSAEKIQKRALFGLQLHKGQSKRQPHQTT